MDFELNSLIGDSNVDNYYKYITFKPMIFLIVVVIIILYFLIFRPFTSSSYLEDSFYDNFSLSNIIGKIFSSIKKFIIFPEIIIRMKMQELYAKLTEID